MNLYFQEFLISNFKNEIKDNKNDYVVMVLCLFLLYFDNFKILMICALLGIFGWVKYVQKTRDGKNNKARHERLLLPISKRELLFYLYMESLLESVMSLIWVAALFKLISLSKPNLIAHLNTASYLILLLSFWIANFATITKLKEVKKHKVSKESIIALIRSSGLGLSVFLLFLIVIGFYFILKFNQKYELIFLGILGVNLLFLFMMLKVNNISHFFQEHSYFKSLKYSYVFDTPVVLLLGALFYYGFLYR